jgi:hypothetical protein
MALDFVGDASWDRAGPNRWHCNGWELDRLIVPMRGSIEGQDAYISGLTRWGAADDDDDMFLSDFPSDDHKQFPTLSLTYLGRRNGVMPPDRNELTSSLQQVTGIAFSDAYILTFGLPPHWQAKITYMSPVLRFTKWTRTTPDFDQITPPTPPTITRSDIASLVVGGIDYSVWQAAAPYYDQIVTWVLQWFAQRTARYTSWREDVPGQYFRAVVTQQVLLLPLQEEIPS